MYSLGWDVLVAKICLSLIFPYFGRSGILVFVLFAHWICWGLSKSELRVWFICSLNTYLSTYANLAFAICSCFSQWHLFMYACRLRISPLCYFCWYYILLIFFIIYSALAAASSPLGVVSGAIAGHGAATVVSTRDSQVAKFLVTVTYLKLCGSHYTKYRI